MVLETGARFLQCVQGKKLASDLPHLLEESRLLLFVLPSLHATLGVASSPSLTG